jgi:outer membrane biosynthesis protein TonB
MIAIIFFLGIIFSETAIKENSTSQQNQSTKVVVSNTVETKPVLEEVKVEPQKTEPIKEEVKVEPQKTEPIKEEVKVEPQKTEPIKEEVKVEPQKTEPIKEEVSVKETETNYLKIILYIIGGILAIFTGAYLFSNRKSNQSSISSVDSERKDIEENAHVEPQVQEPEPQLQEPEPQLQEPEPQVQEPEPQVQEPEPQELPVDEDENNKK